MKIIKEGNKHVERPIQATCYNCDSTLEFLPSEAEKQYNNDPREQHENFYGNPSTGYKVKCPVCGHGVLGYQ